MKTNKNITHLHYVGNVPELLKQAREKINNGNRVKISISHDNVKLEDGTTGDAIPSISLLPVYTCPAGVPCCKDCYACRMARYKNAKTAWARNTAIYEDMPNEYFRQLERELFKNRFFRVHVSGDVPDAAYFEKLVGIVRKNPGCNVLIFTKQYDIVNHYVDTVGPIPENMHLIFSNWNSWTCDNPHGFPVTDVIKPGTACPADGKLCGGNCYECARRNGGCWNLQHGKKLYFYLH